MEENLQQKAEKNLQQKAEKYRSILESFKKKLSTDSPMLGTSFDVEDFYVVMLNKNNEITYKKWDDMNGVEQKCFREQQKRHIIIDGERTRKGDMQHFETSSKFSQVIQNEISNDKALKAVQPLVDKIKNKTI